MNSRGVAGTRERHTLRRGLLAIVVGAVVYVAVVAVVIVQRFSPAAASLQGQSRDALEEFIASQSRASRLDTVARSLGLMLSDTNSVPAPSTLDRLRQDVQAIDDRARTVERLLSAPLSASQLREILTNGAQGEARLRSTLLATIAALELGDRAQAATYLSRAREIEVSVRDAISRAAALVLEEVRLEQASLASEVRTATTLLAVWLGIGVLLVPVVMFFLRRRLQEPLDALDAGFHRIASGDLAVQLRTEPSDEFGRLAGHFNRMTTVLRQRVTEEAERSALQTAARMKLILDSALDAVVVMDEGGLVREWNPRAEETFGWTREDAMGSRLSDLIIPPESRDAHGRGLAAHVAGAPPVMQGRLVEAEAVRRDGTRIAVELTITRIERDGLVEFSAFIRDVSEKLRLDRELREAQKLEAIGQLAGGVAHDFNNLLTAVIGNANLIGADPEATPQIREDAEQIVSVAGRGAALSRSLLTLARRGNGLQGVEVFKLTSVVREVVDIVSRAFDRRIEIVLAIGEGESSTVRGDRSQILNAVLNLALNGRDAMPEGGQMTFGLRTVQLDASFCAGHAGLVAPGTFIELTVSDTGVGITSEVRARIFEPFFTTKRVGEGSGLGLAMVYGTVLAHHGMIDVQSAPGRGAVFRLYFPPETKATEEAPAPEHAATGGRARILLVDDELEVRLAGTRLLRSLGYTVENARDGREAIERIRDDPEPFDLVILDGNMPRMSGSEAARVIRGLRPELPLVLATGYFGPAIEGRFEADGFMAAVAKPYSVGALSREIERLVKGSDAPPAGTEAGRKSADP